MKDSDEGGADADTETPVIAGADDDAWDDNTNAPPVVDTRPEATSEPAASRAPMLEWVNISVGWWAEGALDDGSFLQSIQYLIDQGIIDPGNEVRGRRGRG